MCVQVPKEATKGHWISWSWSYRLWYWESNSARAASTLNFGALSQVPFSLAGWSVQATVAQVMTLALEV